MNVKRLKELSEDFKKSLAALGEALKENPDAHSLFVDGTIQRFEAAFELAWKLLKGTLHSRGLEMEAWKEVIHESARENLIEAEPLWMEMLNDRDRASHVYEEKESRMIYERIKKSYFGNLKNWQCSIESRCSLG